jgi:hypothetical protein
VFTKTKGFIKPPRKRRPTPSRFEKTSEWKQLKKAMDAGLTPETTPGRDDATACVIQLTDADKKTMGLVSRRTIARFVQKYVKEHGFNYRVLNFRHENNDFIVVKGAGEGPKRHRAGRASTA